QREAAALAPEAVEPADGELVAERWATRHTVVARQQGAPVRQVQIGEATEQPCERGAVAEQLAAESPGVHADGQVEATLVAERRRQMEPASRVSDVADGRAAVGAAPGWGGARGRGGGRGPRGRGVRRWGGTFGPRGGRGGTARRRARAGPPRPPPHRPHPPHPPRRAGPVRARSPG